jgi:hypothetical protein
MRQQVDKLRRQGQAELCSQRRSVLQPGRVPGQAGQRCAVDEEAQPLRRVAYLYVLDAGVARHLDRGAGQAQAVEAAGEHRGQFCGRDAGQGRRTGFVVIDGDRGQIEHQPGFTQRGGETGVRPRGTAGKQEAEEHQDQERNATPHEVPFNDTGLLGKFTTAPAIRLLRRATVCGIA